LQGFGVARAFGGTLPAGAAFDKSPSKDQRYYGIDLQSLVAWEFQMSLERVIQDSRGPGSQVIGLVKQTGAQVALASRLEGRAEGLAALFKAMGHEGRLMILCHLADGERSVNSLEELLGQRQAAVSQQLARLRLEGLVTTRREGKTIYYAILDQRVLDLLRTLPGLVAA